MRNKNWLRYGIASASLAGLVMSGVLVACGDDDSGTTPGTDAGTDTNTPGTDSGGDTGTPDSSKPDAGQPAKLVLVHGATDLGPENAPDSIRVCFATAPKSDANNFQVTPFPVLPHSLSDGGATDNPGILVGTGGAFPSSGADYEDLVIRPYVMNAQRLNERGIVGNAATTPRCNQVLKDGFVPDAGWDGGEPLQANKDFWQLADIPAGVLKKNHTYILALTGCTADTDGVEFAGKCGKDDNGNEYVPPGTPGIGNLKIMIVEVDAATTPAGTELGAQFLHLSPQWDIGGVRPGLVPGITNDPTDGGAFQPAAAAPDGGFRFVRDGGATPMVKLQGVLTNKAFYQAHPLLAQTAIPLNNVAGGGNPTVQFITTGKGDAAELYVNGKAYTFIAVGDPADTATGLRKFHYLGFPNQFTPPPLQ
jgi:hypothetical protein